MASWAARNDRRLAEEANAPAGPKRSEGGDFVALQPADAGLKGGAGYYAFPGWQTVSCQCDKFGGFTF